MNRALPLALAALLLSACVAETVERRRPRKGPVKEVGFVDFGGGHVRYSAEGWSWAVASRRRLALKLMARNCGKELEPRITDEYTRQDADAPYAGQDIGSSMSIGDEHFNIERYVHVSYECRVPGAAEPAVSTAAARGPLLVIPAVSVSSAAAAVEISTASSVTSAPAVAASTAAAAAPVVSTAAAPSQEPPK